MSWYKAANQSSFLNTKLAELFGVYSGNWTEKSIRKAGTTISPEVDSQIAGELQRAHPPTYFGGGKADTYGHWLMRDGTLTGQVLDHEESANQALKTLPSYRRRIDGITDLMSLSGVIRVRMAKGKALVLDIVHKPTTEQLMKIGDLGKMIEDSGGVVMWQVLDQNDTGTLHEGMDTDSLFDVPWERMKAF
jgi:hypothetical protein